MEAGVRLWPLLLGWTVVALLASMGFRRQALIAGAGMAIVSVAVLSVAGASA